MTFYQLSSLNYDSVNIPITESNIDDSPSFDLINDIFNPKSSSSNLNEDEKIDEKIYFIPIKKVDKKNKFIFKTETAKKKRGPKKHKDKKKAEHTDWDRDNITSKIQTHYLNFIFSFLNDCVPSSFLGKKRIKFLNINHKYKRKASREHLERMKKSTILDILRDIDISSKNKYADKNINKINAEALIKDPWFKKIIEMKYLDLFLDYYNDEKPLQELMIFDKKIKLSEKTKSFYHLLKKYENLKDQIIYFCKIIYSLSDLHI